MKDVTLNQREQARLQVLNSVLEYQLPTTQAAEVLGISERQVRRILAAYRREGAAALVPWQPRTPAPQRGPRRRRHCGGHPGQREVRRLQPQPPDRGAGGTGRYSPEPPDAKPSPKPPRSAQPPAAPSPQTPGTSGADAPGGHVAADRRQPSPLAGRAGTQVRPAAGGG